MAHIGVIRVIYIEMYVSQFIFTEFKLVKDQNIPNPSMEIDLQRPNGLRILTAFRWGHF